MLGTIFANKIIQMISGFRSLIKERTNKEATVMSSYLGPLQVECDAPPYPIVRACRKLGMNEPEDVRWCRKGHHSRRSHGWIHFLTNPFWGREEAEEHLCVCGRQLPILESYCFTFQTGEQVEYEMAQCPRCRTIYWEKA